MKSQAYRVSFATLFVNGYYYGFVCHPPSVLSEYNLTLIQYSLTERLDTAFMQSHFNVDDTNLYQIGGAYYATYLGSVPAPYQMFTNNVFGMSVMMNFISI